MFYDFCAVSLFVNILSIASIEFSRISLFLLFSSDFKAGSALVLPILPSAHAAVLTTDGSSSFNVHTNEVTALSSSIQPRTYAARLLVERMTVRSLHWYGH